MDPNETLKRIREKCAALRSVWDEEVPLISDGDVRELLELVEALDQRLTKGGSMPRAWERKST